MSAQPRAARGLRTERSPYPPSHSGSCTDPPQTPSWLKGTSPEITQRELNTFRFRWVFELKDDVDTVTVPIEAKFYAFWSDGGDEPLPDETIVSDLHLKLASIYPFE